jgi:hypothetical protein
VGRQRRAQQRAADDAAPGGDDDAGAPHGGRHVAGRHHEARVADRDAQRGPWPEGLLQPGQPRVGVHQHGVEPAVGDARRALVEARLALAAADEDVAQAAGDERARRPQRLGGLEQRDELGRELLAPEGEHLDQQRGRARGEERAHEHPPPQHERVLHRAGGVAADQLAVGGHAERGQRDEPDAGRRLEAARQLAAAEQGDVEALAQHLGQRERAHQVAEPHRVLAVHEQRRAAVAHGTSSRAPARSAPRRAAHPGCRRLTACAARVVSSAAATCQRRAAGEGSGPPAP